MTTQRPNFSQEHAPFVKDYVSISVLKVRAGDVIHFTYDGKPKLVLVLNPNWDGKLHGVSLRALPRASFIKIFKQIGNVDETRLYEGYLKNNSHHPYRTYFTNKIQTVRLVNYKV